MRRLFTYFLFVLLVSCSGSAPVKETPEGVLEKSEFISLLVDLEILEAHFQYQFSRVNAYHNALDSSSTIVFEHHRTTRDVFEKSMDHYATIPDSLYLIYEAALDSINFRISASSNTP